MRNSSGPDSEPWCSCSSKQDTNMVFSNPGKTGKHIWTAKVAIWALLSVFGVFKPPQFQFITLFLLIVLSDLIMSSSFSGDVSEYQFFRFDAGFYGLVFLQVGAQLWILSRACSDAQQVSFCPVPGPPVRRLEMRNTTFGFKKNIYI